MAVIVYANNMSKTKRSMKKEGKDKDYAKFRDIFAKRADDWRTYFRYIDNRMTNLVEYIRVYKKSQLVSLKQIWFSPIDKLECWEIRDRQLRFLHRFAREIDQRGIEKMYTHYICVVYKDMEISINNTLYEEFDLLNVYNEVSRFFKLLSDYKEEVKK